MLLTFEVDVLAGREEKLFPCRNIEDPGLLLLVYGDDGLNSTTDYAGLAVGLNSLVVHYEGLDCVTEEADRVFLEEDRHDGWCSLVSCACLREKLGS
jgi:hypothetical protein